MNKDRRSRKINGHGRSSSIVKPVASSAHFCNEANKTTKKTNGVGQVLNKHKPRYVAAPICGGIRGGRSPTSAHSVASATDRSFEMAVLRTPRCVKRALTVVLLVGGAVAAAVGRTVKPPLSAAGDTAATAEAGTLWRFGFLSATRLNCRSVGQGTATRLGV